MKFPLQINGVTLFSEFEDYFRIHQINQDIWDLLAGKGINIADGKVYESYKFIFESFLKNIDKYPNVAQFKSNLSAFYGTIGEKQKAIDLMKTIVQKHPNYIAGKLDLANYYITTNKFKKAITILGVTEELHFKDMMPNKKDYMFSDFIHFNSIAIPIHILKHNQYNAKGRKYDKKRELELSRAHTKLSAMIWVDENNERTQVMMKNLKVKKLPNFKQN